MVDTGQRSSSSVCVQVQNKWQLFTKLLCCTFMVHEIFVEDAHSP